MIVPLTAEIALNSQAIYQLQQIIGARDWGLGIREISLTTNPPKILTPKIREQILE